MSRILTIANQKGGVGKTTTAVNLAASLAAAERRTLLVDIDPQGNAGSALGIRRDDSDRSIYEVLLDGLPLAEAVRKTELKYLDFVPCNVQTLQMEERIQRVADDRSMLRNVLRAVTREYDFVILDCPPTLRGMCTNALAASDSVRGRSFDCFIAASFAKRRRAWSSRLHLAHAHENLELLLLRAQQFDVQTMAQFGFDRIQSDETRKDESGATLDSVTGPVPPSSTDIRLAPELVSMD